MLHRSIDRRSLITSTLVFSAATAGGLGLPLPAAAADEDLSPANKGRFIVEALQRDKEEHGGEKSLAPPPEILPFRDWDYYYLRGGEAVWSPNPGDPYKPVVVPAGFVTDLASTPALLWFRYPPQGRYAIAAIVHDYLYWQQDRSRREADEIFRLAMRDSEVDGVTQIAFWAVLRAAGGSAWRDNARRKARGEKRFLKQFPPSLTTSWSDWRKRDGVFGD